MTLEEAVTKFETRFQKVRRGQPRHWALGVGRYTTLGSGGVRAEGALHTWYKTEPQAVAAWLLAATSFAGSYGGSLWWREVPQMIRSKRGLTVWSRFAIGRKPVREKAA